jgi:hypothetical protein
MSETHDARSIEIYESIAKLDFENGDQLGLKCGGEGDNGERLLDLLDLHFEAKDGPAQFDEICDNCIIFRLNDDGTHPPAVERVAQRFLKESGRTLVDVEGDHDDGWVRYNFTPFMEMEEAEEWETKVRKWL